MASPLFAVFCLGINKHDGTGRDDDEHIPEAKLHQAEFDFAVLAMANLHD